MISSHPVIVFSKTTCSYCAMAKNLLNEVGVHYDVEEIDRRNDTDKLQDVFAKITSARTVSCVLTNLFTKLTTALEFSFTYFTVVDSCEVCLMTLSSRRNYIPVYMSL